MVFEFISFRREQKIDKLTFRCELPKDVCLIVDVIPYKDTVLHVGDRLGYKELLFNYKIVALNIYTTDSTLIEIDFSHNETWFSLIEKIMGILKQVKKTNDKEEED